MIATDCGLETTITILSLVIGVLCFAALSLLVWFSYRKDRLAAIQHETIEMQQALINTLQDRNSDV